MKYEDLKADAPPPLPPEDRARLAADIRARSHNQNREHIAQEIEAGDLYEPDGAPKSYWHCLATEKPQRLPGRRGQWKASAAQPSGWEWQDWGRG